MGFVRRVYYSHIKNAMANIAFEQASQSYRPSSNLLRAWFPLRPIDMTSQWAAPSLTGCHPRCTSGTDSSRGHSGCNKDSTTSSSPPADGPSVNRTTLGTIWWRHQMETFSALLAICAGNSPVTGEIPAQRPVTPSFDVFFDLHLKYFYQLWKQHFIIVRDHQKLRNIL